MTDDHDAARNADPAADAPRDEDRPYHHGGLRAELMTRALARIAEAGVDKLSLRALAREAGVSATAPYRHFPTRHCLLAALATDGFGELLRVAQDAIESHGDDPPAALRAIGRAYIAHARREPVKYRLMFGSVIGDFAPYADLHAAADASIAPLLETLRAGIARGDFVDRPVAALAGFCWSTVHGIANLLIDKAPTEHDAAAAGAASGERSDAMSVLESLGGGTEAALDLLMRGVLREPDRA